MSKLATLGFLLLATTGAAHAEVLKLRCTTQDPNGIDNILHYDLDIDLSRKTVHMKQVSSVQSNNKSHDYNNHKEDLDNLDPGAYVIVSADKVIWDYGKVTDGDATVYDRNKNVMNDHIAKYPCEPRND